MDRSALIRQVALGVLVFGATLMLLVGLSAVLGRWTAGPSSAPVAGATGAPVPTLRPPAASTTPSGDPPSSPGPIAVGDPVLIGAGDIGDCDSDGDEATAALLDGIGGTVFTAGDNVYDDGTLEQFEACYHPGWGRHRDRTWPAPGNHDWRDGLAGYRAYFGDAAAGSDGASWYARDLGTWRVIVLDSACEKVGGCGPDSSQGRWLAAELAANERACSVAIFHSPRWSSGEEHGDDPAMDPFWRALHAAGVDIVVNGHDHDYERFAPQDPDGRADPEGGIRQFVVGTGGRPLRAFDDPRPNSELRASVAFGVLALTLRDGSYEWQFHAADTDFGDRGTTRCH